MAVRDSVSMIKMILYGTGWLAELGVTPNLLQCPMLVRLILKVETSLDIWDLVVYESYIGGSVRHLLSISIDSRNCQESFVAVASTGESFSNNGW